MRETPDLVLGASGEEGAAAGVGCADSEAVA
jgi:hypothetical protein